MPWRRRRALSFTGDDILKVTVIGAGTMGRGIAQVFAQAGNEVVLTDVYEKALSLARDSINTSLSKLAKKGELKENPDTVMSRIDRKSVA